MSHCLEVHPRLQIINVLGSSAGIKGVKDVKMMQQQAVETVLFFLVPPERLPDRPLPADGSHHVLQTDMEQLHGAWIPVSGSGAREAPDLRVKKLRAQNVYR